MDEELIIYLNGEFVSQSQAKISVFDQGVLFGDGIFEGLRVYSRRIFKCDEHIDRLYDGAKCIMLEMPLRKEELKAAIIETCRRNSIQEGYIRLVVTRGIGDLGLLPARLARPTVFCIVSKLLLYPLEMYEKGMPIITAMRRRSKASILDPQVKSLNYLNNILAKIEAVQAGVPEALMLTEDGFVAECAGDNIFIVKDRLVFTPPVHVGILNGITRRTVIGLVREIDIDLVEKEFTLFNVYSADECFLTGTAAEIIPVRSVDGRVIGNGNPGPITKKLAKAFNQYATTQGTPIYQEWTAFSLGRE
jgi:branched-chain amino acid aminotransferase